MPQSLADTPVARQAMDIVHNSETNDIRPEVLQFLQRAIEDLWQHIQAQPDTYIMTQLEFRVFNYFRARFVNNSTAQRAIARYWDNTSNADGLVPP